jgi:hypothetical protein
MGATLTHVVRRKSITQLHRHMWCDGRVLHSYIDTCGATEEYYTATLTHVVRRKSITQLTGVFATMRMRLKIY